MRIEVAELWRQRPAQFGPISVIADCGPCPWEAALYLPIPRAAELAKLDSLVQGVQPAVRRSIDAVVVRPHPDDALRFRTEPTLARSLSQRVEGRPCYTAEIVDGAHALRPLDVASPITADHQQRILRSLRHAELETLTHRPSVILPKTGSFHYEGPNGTHYECFLRPGMAMQSPGTVDGVVFWLLPRVKPGTGILLDTWSLMSLGYALQIAANGAVTRVASVERYDESVDDVLRRLADPEGRLPGRILLIVSISSTGTLIRRLVAACERDGRSVVDPVSLFSSMDPVQGGPEDVFCRVSPEFRRVPAGDCRLCKDHRRPIVKIDRSTYLLEMSAAVETAALTIDVSKPAKQFFELYRGTGCVSVHRTDPLTKRHHMLYVDVGVLLANQTFRERLDERVRPLRGMVKAVICPTHVIAVRLARSAVASLGLTEAALVVADENDIARLPQAQADLIKESGHVLVVDDVTITGHRLRGFRHALVKAGLGEPVYHFLVGVERTPSAQQLKGITDMAHRPGTLLAVDRLMLPNWSEIECPWCWEFDRLNEVAAKHGDLGEVMRTRYSALRDVVAGLSNDLFLHVSEADHRPSQLGPQSIFGRLDRDVEVFAAVASTMQRLRSEGRLNERFQTPLAKVLDPDLTFKGRYYVTVIAASILRSARAHDLRAPTTELDLSREFESRLAMGNVESDLRSEILLAAARSVIPSVDHSRAFAHQNNDLPLRSRLARTFTRLGANFRGSSQAQVQQSRVAFEPGVAIFLNELLAQRGA